MESFFYLVVMICWLPLTVHSRPYCKETYDDLKCSYNVYCKEYYISNNLEFYQLPFHDDLSRPLKDICVESIYYDQYNLAPINLIFQDTRNEQDFTDTDDTIPRVEHNVWGVDIIVSLNLSHNNYNQSPNLKEMKNLAILDISHNLLTTAELYNIYELPLLTEIDLSHNTISDIKVLSDQHIYRKLKKINLSNNYLVSISEAVFDAFEDLETLDVSHNFIDTLTPLTFEGIKQLVYLNMSNNRLFDINSSLFRFNKLKLLQLSFNKLKHLRTRDFEKLIGLEDLDLSSNSITIIEKNVFQNMPMLNNLDLNNNMLESMDKEMLSNVTNLRLINLSVNNFKVLPIGLFKGKTISSFFIQGNSLEGSLARGTFEGLKFIPQLDLSNQKLMFIEDFAFFGLERLNSLLLNNNCLESLAKKSFKTLQYLHNLDLSNNKITNINFDKEDLHSLQMLSLKNNYLTQVQYEHFQGLSSLQFLGLSDNNISHLEPNSFKSLKELISFEISNNPLNNTLEKNTFDGLNSLPSLDISCTSLTSIQNSSFSDMVQLRNLNISHSFVEELQYNTFLRTGVVETIDLSFNKLQEFNVNTSELANLGTLYLNNNLIKTLSPTTLHGLPRLIKVILSHNNIEYIHFEALKEQNDLRTLDLSYNSKLTFNVSIIKALKKMKSLYLSRITKGVCFTYIGDFSLSQLEISNSNLTDVKSLDLKELSHLDQLVLSYNDIARLEVGAFSKLNSLKTVDLSYNKIAFIQPGSFKDNTLLNTLNISHNSLSTLTYGIFRGLIYLNTLDVSYNHINSLQSERFYELSSLSVLIADHNKIESINSEDLIGTRLTKLSIGENPLPCEILVNFQKRGAPFEITAIRLDEKSDDENIDGVTCNMKKHIVFNTKQTYVTLENDKVLADIRNILLNYFNKTLKENKTVITPNNDPEYFKNITNTIEKSIIASNQNVSSYFSNVTTEIVYEYNNTNILLEKILKALTLKAVRGTTPAPITKENATYENILSYIGKMKLDIEDNIAHEKHNVLKELDKRVSQINSQIELLSDTNAPKNEKLQANDVPRESRSLFTDTCVSLILFILVSFVLYKFYKSRMFIRHRFSISTRELPGAMENSTL